MLILLTPSFVFEVVPTLLPFALFAAPLMCTQPSCCFGRIDEKHSPLLKVPLSENVLMYSVSAAMS